MKNFKIIFSLFAALSFALTSCGTHASSTDQQGKEYTSAYICPMHCEGSGSDKAGECPVCHMDYVANTEQGKEYTSAYVCPMHCEGSGSDKAGECPVCHMDYVANTDHQSHSH